MDDLGETVELRRDVRTFPDEVKDEIIERDDADDLVVGQSSRGRFVR